MKLPLAILIATVAVEAAIDEKTAGRMIKICGDDLLLAIHEACTKNTVNYLLEHGLSYDNPEEHKPQHSEHHHPNLGHGHDRSLSHDHGIGHDSHDHEHGHDDGTNYDPLEYQAPRQKYEDDAITVKCCRKPCLVKEFIQFCDED